MEAPAGRPARDGATQVSHVIHGFRIPSGVAAPKRLLIVNGNNAAEVPHPAQVFAGLCFCLQWGLRVARTMWRNEIHPGGLQIVTELITVDVAAVRGGDEECGINLASKL